MITIFKVLEFVDDHGNEVTLDLTIISFNTLEI